MLPVRLYIISKAMLSARLLVKKLLSLGGVKTYICVIEKKRKDKKERKKWHSKPSGDKMD